MTFGLLALITTAGLAGPLLAALPRLGLPLVVGEIAAGVLLGRTGLGWIDAGEPTTAFLSEVGFAMLMFVVGTRLPLRDPGLRDSVRPAALAALLTLAFAVPAGFALALVGPDRPLVLAVVVATSSAAVALPILQGGSDGSAAPPPATAPRVSASAASPPRPSPSAGSPSPTSALCSPSRWCWPPAAWATCWPVPGWSCSWAARLSCRCVGCGAPTGCMRCGGNPSTGDGRWTCASASRGCSGSPPWPPLRVRASSSPGSPRARSWRRWGSPGGWPSNSSGSPRDSWCRCSS